MQRSTVTILSITFSIFAGILLAWWPDVALALALENSPFAWLQSSLLVACGSVLGIRALIHPDEAQTTPGGQPMPWVALSLLLVLAALDERFMGHERLQEFLFYDLLHGEPTLKPWTQAVTALYGIAGLAALLWLRRAMTAPAWRWCRAGIAVGISAIALDIAVDAVDIQLFEEMLETTAETLFLCGLFIEVGRAVSLRR